MFGKKKSYSNLGPTETYLYVKPLSEYLDSCFVCGAQVICHTCLIEINGQQYHEKVCPKCSSAYAVA